MRGALLRIVAVAVVAAAASCTSSDESVAGAAPSPVSNLEVQKVTDAEVHLRWSLPPTSVESITILRNGTAIASLPGSTKEFTDQRVDPGTRYRYEVKTTSGAVSSSPVEISTKTIVPPVNEARLDGTYKMTFTTLSSNVDNPGPSVTKGRWRLIPLCNQGPCDARFKTLSGGYSTRLAWIPSDGRYLRGPAPRGQRAPRRRFGSSSRRRSCAAPRPQAADVCGRYAGWIRLTTGLPLPLRGS
jgi:hypothetical protein